MSSSNEDDYEVGYGKPPKHTRWKAGQSGNPKGRPKRPRDVVSILTTALAEEITIRERDRERTLTNDQAAELAQMNAAMRGDQAAFHAVIKQMMKYRCIPSAWSKPKSGTARGFLVVEEPMTEEEWERRFSSLREALASPGSTAGGEGDA